MFMDSEACSVDWADPINKSHSLNAGRIAWWIAAPNFHGGIAWRDLVNKRILQLTHTVPSTAWSAHRNVEAGVWGDVRFNGSSDEGRASSANDLSRAAASLHGLGSGTIAVTARFTTGQSNAYVLSLPSASGGDNGFDIHLSSATAIRTWLRTSVTTAGLSATYTYTNVGWLRILAAYDGATLKLFINGVEVATTNRTGTIRHESNETNLGHFGTFGLYAACNIAEATIWNRGLSPAEAWEDFRLGRQHNRELLNRWTRRFFALGASESSSSKPNYYFQQQALLTGF